MRRILMLSLLAAAACGGPSRGHLVVDWTFSGVSCANAGVANIAIDITNEVLTPSTFACRDAPVGVDLGSYLVGNYDLTITGYDAAGTVTHQQTQTLAVHGGENQYAIDVPAITGNANISWTFDGKSCATAGVDTVTIFVDPDARGVPGFNAGTVACSTLNTDGASVEALAPGSHTFAIFGWRTLSTGPQLLYRTHSPPSYLIEAGKTANVFVSAESPP